MSNLIAMLRDNVQANPERPIYRFWQDGSIASTVTFASLEQQARAVALHLQQVSHPGDRVVLMYPYGPGIIMGFFGCLASGRISVPVLLPAMLPKDRQMEILKLTFQDSGASTVLTTCAMYEEYRSSIEAAGIENVNWVAADEIAVSAADAWPVMPAGDDQVALLLYTSGSTRLPRGVALTHGNLQAFLRVWSTPFKGRQNDLDVAWAPLQHGAGLARVILPLGHDRKLIFLSSMAFIQSPISWLRLITQYRATLIGASNYAYQTCVDRITPAEREGLDLSSLEYVNTGGEPIRIETIRRFNETYAPYGFSPHAFQTVYGLSECTVLGTGSLKRQPVQTCWIDVAEMEQMRVREVPPESAGGRLYVSSGCVQPEHDLRIVDPQTCVECGPEGIGEIWLAGPGVASGYWNKPEETAEVFHGYLENGNGPFLRSGDLGFVKNGELYVTGRIKDVIIIHGRNISAVDFEMAAAGAHPALQAGAAAAFGINMDGEEKVVIMQEVRPGHEQLDVEEVARLVRLSVSQKLNVPLFAVVLVKLGNLPRTGSGKIQRYLCRTRYLEAQSDLGSAR